MPFSRLTGTQKPCQFLQRMHGAERTITRLHWFATTSHMINIVYTDGAASQFKQRYLFQNLTRTVAEHALKLSWNFFATSHGKGVVDAIGGTVKRMV
ncbi:unnamed protein product, partial [Didymodactylos carnosus]